MKRFFNFLLVLLLQFVCIQNAISQTVASGTWTAKYFKSYQQQETPPDNWYSTDFDDSEWGEITGPLTDGKIGAKDAYWCRQYIYLTAEQIAEGNFLLRFAFQGDVSFYVNGYNIENISGNSSLYTMTFTNSYFKPGFNLIAARCYNNNTSNGYFDFRFSTNKHQGDIFEAFSTGTTGEPEIRILNQRSTLYNIDQTSVNSNQLNAFVFTKNGVSNQNIGWNSSNSSVATVTNGLVSAVAVGTTTITATAVVDGKIVSSSCDVNVVSFDAGMKVVYVDEAGTLGSLLTQEEKNNVTRLAVFGNINADDIAVLRYMAGRDEYANMSDGQLSELDLSEVKFVSGGSFKYSKESKNSINDISTIPSYMFQQCGSLTKVILPNSAQKIGYGAFRECKYLSEVVIPEGYTTINSDVFQTCTSLTSIDIPSTMTSLGSSAFYNCTRLSTVNIPENSKLTEIRSTCFHQTGLTSFTLPKTVTVIKETAFYGCQKLSEFIIPEGSNLREIENRAFDYCTKLATFNIPEDSKITTIGESAFGNCPLTSFYAPKSLKSMLSQGFRTDKFTTFTIHPENTYIQDVDGIVYGRLDQNIIYKPSNLTGTIRVPDFIKGISENMYRDMSQVTAIVLPASITYIDNYAFQYCWNLRTIISSNTKAPVLDDYSFESISKENITLYVPESAVDTYKAKGWDVFGKMEALPKEPVFELNKNSVKMVLTNDNPTATQRISANILTEDGFYNGTVTWQSSNADVASVSETGIVTAIATGNADITVSFTYKEKDYSATCAVNVLNISEISDAYYVEAGKLSEMIPESEKYNIKKLVLFGEINSYDVRFLRDMAGRDNSFNETSGTLEVLDMSGVNVVEGGNSYYHINLGGCYNSNNRLGDGTFGGCNSLKEVILPETLTEASRYMFRDCQNIQSITLPNTLKSIGNRFAYNCPALKNINLPESVESIDTYAFNNTNLESFNIPAAFTGSLNNWGLENSSIKTITVSEGNNTYKAINNVVYNKSDNQLMLAAKGIDVLLIPADVTSINESAFNGCSSINTIFLLNSNPITVNRSTLQQLSYACKVIVPQGVLDAYKRTSWNYFANLIEGVSETTFRINEEEIALYQTTDESSSQAQLSCFAMTPTSIVTPTVQWRSLNEDVVAVTEEGAVVMTGAGSTKIIAKTTIEGKEYTAEVPVNCYAPSEGEQYVYVKEAGTLAEIIPSSQLSKITNLVLFGQINSTDVQTLRYMAGRDESNNESDGVLKYLDMSQVKLVYDQSTYYTMWGNHSRVNENQLGYCMFAQCNALETVLLPNSVTNSSSYIFYECQNLKEVTLPKNLTSLGSDCFVNCSKLESIVIPAAMESWGTGTFRNCYNLREVTFETGSRLTNINDNTFQNCRNLQKIELPATVSSISTGAFENSGLTEIVIPENSQLTTIGTNAFNGTALTSFYVPEKLRSVSTARINNKSLKSITAHADNAKYKAVDGVLYSKTDNSIALMPQGITGVFRTPDFITSISTNSFKDCSALNSIVLGANVSNIDTNAFANNTSLNSLFCLNPNVITANTGALDGIDKEHVIVFVPTGMKEAYRATTWNEFEYIKEFSSEPQLLLATNKVTLYDTKIEGTRSHQMDAMIITADGPSAATVVWSVEDTNVATVSTDGLIQLVKGGMTQVTATCSYQGKTLTAQCDVNVVGGGDGIDLLYVERAGTVDELLSAEDRARITDLVVIGNVNANDLNVIGDMARSYNGNLTNLDLSEVNVTDGAMGWDAFRDNKDLKSVKLPDNLVTIEGYAFQNCSSLESIVIPEGLKKLGYYAFGDCSNLKEVTVSDIVECESNSFGWSPSEHILTMNIRFSNIEKDLTTLLGEFDSRTTINQLKDGIEITSFDIPDGTKKIGAKRFFGCSSISSLTIPASVQEIGERALEGIADIKFLGKTPATISSSNGWSGMATYVVPADALTAYRTAEKWSDFKAQIIPDDAILELDLTVTAASEKSAVVSKAGGEENLEFVTRLTLHGSINSYDIFAIRTKMPNLHYLDMTDVNIIGNPYEYYSGCYTEDHRLGRRSFVDMTKLIEVHLPKTITEIGDAAFAGCTNLRVIEMHEGIETVSDNAFVACRSMKRFDFPDGIKSFGNYVFVGCTNLEEINFGKGLLTVGSQICYPWYWEEGRDWGGTLNKLHTVRFPESTEYIGSNSFYECYNLKNVLLPKSLKEISYATFQYCRSLEEITLPSGIRSIRGYAFRGCTSLKELRLPPMLETIEDYAFLECDNIKDVYTYVVVPKDIAINQNTFTLKCYEQAMLHVPDFSRYAYMWNTQWGQFAGQTEFSDTYDTFYAKNTLKLDNETGAISGTPDADIHETGGIEVSGDVKQELGEVDLNHNGTDGGSIIPENKDNISIKHLNVKISIEANRWYFFCFPFNVPLNDVKYGGEYVWRQYDGEARSRKQGGWKDLAAGTTELIAGRGYIFQGTNSSTLHLNIKEPEIKCGDASTDLNTYVGADTQSADASWNFVGNPYTSYYEVTEDTYSAPITVWTGNGYEAFRPGDDDLEFAPYQAFFVQSGNNNSSVKFDADKRESKEQAEETKAKAKARRAKQHINPDRLLINFELGVAGEEGYLDKTRVVINDKATAGYDADCDAAKFFSEERRAEIYTIGMDGTTYAINERPETEGTISLGFVANQKGKYTISAQRSDVPVMLIDHVLDISHDLSLGEYEFSSAKGTFNKRFTVKRVSGEATTIDQLSAKIGMSYNISAGNISVDGLDAGTQVALYNMAGQLVASQQGNGTLASQPGVYILSVGKLSAKVVLK